LDPFGVFKTEWATLIVGSNVITWEVDFGGQTLTLTSYAQLEETGTINATLIANEGDFIFYGSNLRVEADPVPEPGTLILLGTGLVGLVGYGKLRLKSRKRS
jgi:hypothetical protein